MKKDPSYLRKQNKKDQLKSRKERLIYEKIEHIYQNNSQLQSIKEMAEDLQAKHEISISRSYINRFIKANIPFNFKKAKKVPTHANSLRNQYMRQQFSIKLLDLLLNGKRILAVDETWFGETNYQRKTW